MNEKIYVYLTSEDDTLDVMEFNPENKHQLKELLFLMFNLASNNTQYKKITLSKFKM